MTYLPSFLALISVMLVAALLALCLRAMDGEEYRR